MYLGVKPSLSRLGHGGDCCYPGFLVYLKKTDWLNTQLTMLFDLLH